MSAQTINYSLIFDSNGNAVIDSVTQAATKLQNNISRTQSVCDKFGASFLKLEMAKRAIEGVGQGFANIMKPGLELETSLADLSAITGATGDKLNEIEGYARKAAKTFGGSAAQSVEAYKLILSKLGPDIADVPTALAAMGDSVSILSKTMGGDSVAAANVLTTAMNQFQVSLDDPTAASKTMADMMNIMAAAAKEGSAELPDIAMALENSGMAAKMAGVSFAETNAAIQVLDKAGKRGAEGGVALRNVMMKLSEGRFMPKDAIDGLSAAGIDVLQLGDKSLTLSQRLNMLKPVLSDTALMSKLFGLENVNAATGLISGTTLMDQYTVSIQGTNTAQEQAGIVMETTAEKMKRMTAFVDNLKIGFFNLAGETYPYIDVMVQTMTTVSDLVPAFDLMTRAIGWLTNAEKLKAFWDGVVAGATAVWTVVQWSLNTAFYGFPVIWIVAGIAALVAGIVIAWNKFEKFRAVILTVWDTMKGFGRILKDFVIDRVKGIISGLGAMGSALYKLFTGDFAGAWESAKQGVVDLSGFNAVKKAVNSSKELVKGIGDNYSTNLKNEQAKAAATQVAKYNPLAGKDIFANYQPASLADSVSTGLTTNPATNTGSNVAKKTTDTIAQGGTRNTEININFRNMVETISFSGGLKENAQNLRRQVEEVMMQVLNQAKATA